MTFGIVSSTRARNPWSVLQWFTNADRDKCTPVFCNLRILKYISKNSVHCMLIQQCFFYLQGNFLHNGHMKTTRLRNYVYIDFLSKPEPAIPISYTLNKIACCKINGHMTDLNDFD